MRVHLVRHARALPRRGHQGPDRDRALNDRGRTQADALAGLSLFDGVERVISSPAVRCVDTVARLAHRLGVDVEQDERLFEGNAGAVVFELALSHGADVGGSGDLLLCSHGDLIPDALHLAQLRGARLIGSNLVAKGSTWSLDFDGERVTTATYTAAPEA